MVYEYDGVCQYVPAPGPACDDLNTRTRLNPTMTG